MSIKFLVLGGGGVFWVWGGGGKCRFYFYGRGDFSEFWSLLMHLGPFGSADCTVAQNLRLAIALSIIASARVNLRSDPSQV